MTQKTIDYFRLRERAERQAMDTATCPEARMVHEQMADSYARLVELEDLKAAGAIAPGKVTRIAEALRARDDAEYGRRALREPITGLPRVHIL